MEPSTLPAYRHGLGWALYTGIISLHSRGAVVEEINLPPSIAIIKSETRRNIYNMRVDDICGAVEGAVQSFGGEQKWMAVIYTYPLYPITAHRDLALDMAENTPKCNRNSNHFTLVESSRSSGVTVDLRRASKAGDWVGAAYFCDPPATTVRALAFVHIQGLPLNCVKEGVKMRERFTVRGSPNT